MSRFVAFRRVSLGVPLLLCLVISVYGMIWLASWSRTRSPAGSGSSDERLITRARKLLEAGRPREALLAISGVRRQGQRAADLLLVQGLARAAMGDSEAARQALLRSTAIHFEQPMAFKVLAAIAFSRGEEQRGLEYLAQAATLDPGDFRPLYAIGEVHLRMGRMDPAIRAFEAALLRKADHEESRIGLLTAALAIRAPEESTELVRELQRDCPRSPHVHVLVARHARSMGDAESALQSVERALQLDPDFVEALVLRASLLYVRGEARLALSDATRASEREPRNTQALAILAQVQAALGQVEKSRETQARRRQVVAESERIAELTHQIAEAPDDPVPRWQLGQLAAATGAKGLAQESFRAALLRDQLCQPALEGLRSLNGNSPPYALSTASSVHVLARPSAGR